MIIYKITNVVNNKVYIGLTTTPLKKRWYAHIRESKKSEKHLYAAMRKYGLNNFKIEVINDAAKDIQELGRLERKYIKLYNSTDPNYGYNITYGGEVCAWDANPRTKLKEQDVYNIRELYKQCKLGRKQAWELYKDKISRSAFNKIWVGDTWPNLHMDVYTDENKIWHKHNSPSARGELNQWALYTNIEVLEIRKYYVNHTLTETYNKFGSKQNKDSFRQIVDGNGGYTTIPIYKKRINKWFLNGNEINIDNYNPVSTIAESGE